MTLIEGEDAGDGQSLSRSGNNRIYEINLRVCILTHDTRGPLIVSNSRLNERIPVFGQVSDELGEGCRAEIAPDQVGNFNRNRGRQNNRSVRSFCGTTNSAMRLLSIVKQRVEKAGI